MPRLRRRVADMRHRGGGLVAVDGDPHHFRTGAGQRRHLGHRAVDIGGVGVGHRLHDDRRAAADGDIADHDLGGFVAGRWGRRRRFAGAFRACSWGLEYQVFVTFSNGSMGTGTTGLGRLTR